MSSSVKVASWRKRLRADPLPPLLASDNPAIVYWARRDLLGEPVPPVDTLWILPEAESILRRQRPGGEWLYPGKRDDTKYSLLETYIQLRDLVEKYGFTSENSALARAAEFVFSFQTPQGDIRGIYANQYSPNYTAGLLELLIKAGYAADSRVEVGLDWLLSMRQRDGGWAIPLRTVRMRWQEAERLSAPLSPDRSKPFSHMVTGVVLRAFASHPTRRRLPEVRGAAELLASRFFKPDVYVDRRTADFWERVTFPFWFTDIVSALDSLSVLGLPRALPSCDRAIKWLARRQRQNGSFRLKSLRGKRDKDTPLWVDLAVARLFRRFFDGVPS